MKNESTLFTQIKKDHRTVEHLFSQIEKTTERAAKTREKLYAKLREEITRHSQAEEKAIYPKLKEKEGTKDIGLEGIEEHGVVKHLLHKLDTTSVEKDEWMALVTVLKEVIEHHVEEEESEMFKKMRKAFSSEELMEMSRAFQDSKKTALESIKDLVAA